MAQCFGCERTDIKCCPTCARNPYTCNVWHRCEKDCEGYEPKIKSQGDKIRSMSDEELAELFTQYSCEDADYTSLLPIEECKWGTKQEVINRNLQWLKSEAKE